MTYGMKTIIRDGKKVIVPVAPQRQAVYLEEDEDMMNIHGPKSYVNPEECPEDWYEEAVRHLVWLLGDPDGY